MEVKPADFARIAGVSRAVISQKMKNKTLIVNAAALLDTDNPVNAAYIAKHRQKRSLAQAAAYVRQGGESYPGAPPGMPPGMAAGAAPWSAPAGAAAPWAPGSSPDDSALMLVAGVPAREMLDMTLREIVIRFPGLDKIERYSKILKDTIMSAEREQRINERGLTLIPKDFVISRVFEFLNGLAQRLVEYPEAAVDRIIALATSGGENTRIEVAGTMAAGISRIIEGAKESVITELNSLKSKYQKDIREHDRIEDIKEAIEEARNE